MTKAACRDAGSGTWRRDLAPDPASHVDQPVTARSTEHAGRHAATMRCPGSGSPWSATVKRLLDRSPAGPVHSFDPEFRDNVPDQRTVTTCEMHMDDVRSSVLMATVEVLAKGSGTVLICTERGAFLTVSICPMVSRG
jgi:hypothetical protein